LVLMMACWQAGGVPRGLVVVAGLVLRAPPGVTTPPPTHTHTLELKSLLLESKLVNASDIFSGVHCLAPACIRASAASSLAKLRLSTLDVLYLHNAAEVQLEARGKAGFMDTLRAAFKVRAGCALVAQQRGASRSVTGWLRVPSCFSSCLLLADVLLAELAALQELEALRSEGKIHGYGLATWDCFRSPPDARQVCVLTGQQCGVRASRPVADRPFATDGHAVCCACPALPCT
jgi:hypothetical protein